MDFLKTVTGKVVSGVVALVVILAVISWWRMDDATKHDLLAGTGKIVGWFGVMLVLPWALFFAAGWVGRFESNLVSGIFVILLTALDATLLAWLFDWKLSGATVWTFFAAATLLAGVYNLFTCDWIAEKVS
jgi:hypothetical protein